MDPTDRIEELEAQVRELTRVVQELREETQRSPGAITEASAAVTRTASAAIEKTRQIFNNDDVRRNVDKVLGGGEGDTLETRIGGIWLSRITVIMVMTAVVLGARMTLYSDVIGPLHKVIIGYGVAFTAIVYGLYWRKSPSFFPQTILGAGLALYFTTYAASFLSETRIISNRFNSIALLIGCLILLVSVSHWRRSQTVAGIALFLVYYTVIASCSGNQNAETVTYAFVTCSVLAATALIFHAIHRWLLFTWIALIATHGSYIYFFLYKPAGLQMSDTEYFWLSNGFLTVCYLLFSFACILDARKTGEYRRTVAPMAGTNSFIYFILTWIAIRNQYPDLEWKFRLAFAGCLLLFAIMAETSGPRRNYLFQIFIAKAVIMFTLALQAYLSGEKLMVAMAIECFALAISYKRSGIVIFKVLELFLLLITFVACLFHVRMAGNVELGGFTWQEWNIPMVSIRANWFCTVGSATVLAMVAWFYERFVRLVLPEQRTLSGHWFLADTFLDLSTSSMAMLHAAATALLLLTVTIIDRGNDPILPYLLACEAVAMCIAGFLFRAQQLEIGGVLLLVAAHVCYHAFLALGLPGFIEQLNYISYTVSVALFTYIGALLWERYLRRVQGGNPWEHHAVAALPYLAATYMLTTLTARQFTGIQIPMLQNTLGVLLLFVGVVIYYPAIKASGILALGIGATTFCWDLYAEKTAYVEQPDFLPFFTLILLAYIAGERLFVILQRRNSAKSKTEDALRTILVMTVTGLGIYGTTLFAAPHFLTLNWIVLAVTAAFLGALFAEPRYRWAAIALFAAAVGRAFYFDLRSMSLRYQFLTFATASAALLIVSWAYSRYRQRTLVAANGKPAETPKNQSQDSKPEHVAKNE